MTEYLLKELDKHNLNSNQIANIMNILSDNYSNQVTFFEYFKKKS